MTTWLKKVQIPYVSLDNNSSPYIYYLQNIIDDWQDCGWIFMGVESKCDATTLTFQQVTEKRPIFPGEKTVCSVQ